MASGCPPPWRLWSTGSGGRCGRVQLTPHAHRSPSVRHTLTLSWLCRSAALAQDTESMPVRLAMALEQDSSAGREDAREALPAAHRKPPPQPLQLTVPPGAKVAAITGPNTGARLPAACPARYCAVTPSQLHPLCEHCVMLSCAGHLVQHCILLSCALPQATSV